MTKKIQNIFMGFAPKGVSSWDAFQSVCKLIGMDQGNAINIIEGVSALRCLHSPKAVYSA